MNGRSLQGLFPTGRPHGRGVLQSRSGGGPMAGAADAFAVDPAALRPLGPGTKLPDDLRADMERALGASFADVRVHVGAQATSIGAIAFTTGSDIFFAPGRYQPQTAAGRQLIGHELAHVVQQRQGRVRNPLGSGVAVVTDRALEAEAERLGHRAATRRPEPSATTAQRRAGAPGAAAVAQRAWSGNKNWEQEFAKTKTLTDDDFPALPGAAPAKTSTKPIKMTVAKPPVAFAPPPTTTKPAIAKEVASTVGEVKTWKRTSQQSRMIASLAVDDAIRIMEQCAAIKTSSGKGYRFNVGISLGDPKYSGMDVIKVISIHEAAILGVQPTYHIQIKSLSGDKAALSDWTFAAKDE